MVRNHRTRVQAMIQVGLLLIWLLSAPVHQAKELAQSGAVSRSELILAMNTLRVSYGLPALIEDPIVNAVAQNTADTMAANNMSWHIGDVRGRLAAAGYGGGATVWATENFAVGRMSIDEIMQVWSDSEHMRPAVNPAYCHVGAGVAQAADGRYYYVLQAAYTSARACGEYKPVPGGGPPPVSQVITPVNIATPDADGRIYHVVRAGQSFWSIAIAYQITIRDLEVWNNLSRENGLLVGQKLFIPSSGTEGYATPTPVWNVRIATADAEGKIVHEVQPYQALILIAEAYKVKVDTILALNGLQADWPLQVGQKLLIDPGKATPSPLSAIEQLTPDSDGNYYHKVASGEYLAWIASLYDVSLSDLMAWNGLTSASIIRPGQQLLLRVTPPATVTPTPAPPSPTSTTTPTPLAATPTQELTAT
ncbi:MAG TPA: LysM peptidoglycan-binding domain-containing protein, partial [Anaerolineales bacterium]|nr:LysM peptidoglycan-binding domain-containing protein [Anaerolineales bacterium]